MVALSVVMLFALWQNSAGAQAPDSPEQLLERYAATGDNNVLERCRSAIADLRTGNRSRLLHARLLLLTGDTKRALADAVQINRETPDELDAYGLIVDASLLLGDVAQAESAAQWMLRLRPEDVRSLMRGAAVRAAIQDHQGAEQMLLEALARTSRGDITTRAAIGTSLAHSSVRQDKFAEAERLLVHVEALLPAYRPATLLKREMESIRGSSVRYRTRGTDS